MKKFPVYLPPVWEINKPVRENKVLWYLNLSVPGRVFSCAPADIGFKSEEHRTFIGL